MRQNRNLTLGEITFARWREHLATLRRWFPELGIIALGKSSAAFTYHNPFPLYGRDQRCHNRYDAPHRRAGIQARARAQRASGDLFQCEEAS